MMRTVIMLFRLLKQFCYVSQGKKVKCSTSQAKHRLFIGNIPRSWGDEDLKQAVSRVGPGVTGIELVKVGGRVIEQLLSFFIVDSMCIILGGAEFLFYSLVFCNCSVCSF